MDTVHTGSSLEGHFVHSEVALTIDGLSNGKVLTPELLALDEDGRKAMTSSELNAYAATHTPISVAWENLNFSISTRGCGKVRPAKTIHILHDLNGSVLPGSMLAIIGGSGAGKSTLLDILSNRKSSGTVTGNVLFNGVPASELKNFLRRVCGYVTQEDVLKETLTVRETLMFQAELRLDPKVFTKAMRVERVEKVMRELGISHRADMRIGNEAKRGLSGGEKKRVAIGVQLVTDPSVLFLDEPTSGLDAYNSLAVMRLLRKLSQSGKTVVATIHQPRSTIFDLFDRLLVLNQGSTVYQGPAGEATGYFSRLGFDIPAYMNPADYVIDVLLDPNRADMTTTDITKLDFSEAFRASAEAKAVAADIEGSKTRFQKLDTLSEIKPYATGPLKQFVELLGRYSRTTSRDPLASTIALVQALVMAFIIGSIFYQIGYVAPAAIQGRVGVLFFVMIFGAFSLSQATIAFIEERLLVNRERAAGVYAAAPYFLAKVIVDTPVQCLQILLFSIIMYWMAQLNPGAQQFFQYVAIVLCNGLCAASLYRLIGSIAPTQLVGNILVPSLTVLFFLFAGFFISPAAIPSWWIWVYWWSFFRYTYPALMVNEFLGTNFTCAANVTSCQRSGDQVLAIYSVPADASIIWQWCLALLGLTLIYGILTYLVIEFLQKERR